MRRGAGEEERPPVGLAALQQTVLPDMYGSTQAGNFWNPPSEERTIDGKPYPMPLEGNQLESSSAAYAGLLATLLVAPLAWCSRRHRALNILWVVLGVISLAWVLDIPGLVSVLRLPGLNMMSHNRFTFVASFAVMAMVAVGLDLLIKGGLQRRWWFWGPAMLVTGLACSCLFHAMVPPEPLATRIEPVLRHNPSIPIPNISDLAQLRGAMALLARLPGCRRVMRPRTGRLAGAATCNQGSTVVLPAGGRGIGRRSALVRLRPRAAMRSGPLLSPPSRPR